MQQNDRLDDWLAAARSDLAQCTPDLLTEQRLLAHVREMRALQLVAATRLSTSPRRDGHTAFWRRPFRWRTAALAGAATLVGIALSVVVLAPNAPQRDAMVRTPFFALVASEAIAAEPSALIVTSQVAAATLSDYGLPVDPARADQPIRAEFLLSPTGLVLAVRFAE